MTDISKLADRAAIKEDPMPLQTRATAPTSFDRLRTSGRGGKRNAWHKHPGDVLKLHNPQKKKEAFPPTTKTLPNCRVTAA
ncbi:hypothetical protein [Sphingobium baderi]|uniref:hypothetical protein n=1 Tax=Sphingobium baderi TaxID=1332080 RepID=UPI0011DF6DA3|nr:hypothetical protein [Sphingobium baderi]WRD74960.1 hypothetical protein QQ987_09035 [Sphingobium baderi]